MDALRTQLQTLTGVFKDVGNTIRALRSALRTVAGRGVRRPAFAYETVWLDLAFDIRDAQGAQVVLTRRQRVRFLTHESATVRELVWGNGEPLARYSARGARRVGERFEGSKRALLLDPETRTAPGTCVTLTSQRTMRNAFLGAEEFCEAVVERPTGRLAITVRFPATRPPRRARLVAATTEHVLQTLRVRYDAAGRAVLRCRVQRPVIGTVYSVRWVW
jgi:hypothetical protein